MLKERLDTEWIELILLAKSLGLSKGEVMAYIKNNQSSISG
ncbi:anti-repressor SinI [Scopulibacillus darangshiensis]|uniref:Anti-repressor SinI n=1 Tax=Scopulibacillus darangshiensis TaxID=442528 RepID=A0A4R2P8R3_9BACL|nr:anti-repressor SinI family protein [Scopulibacillus darangshiensis]TCP30245.1 anti-repressor SinI [Scopulibacillus darangshiensis]